MTTKICITIWLVIGSFLTLSNIMTDRYDCYVEKGLLKGLFQCSSSESRYSVSISYLSYFLDGLKWPLKIFPYVSVLEDKKEKSTFDIDNIFQRAFQNKNEKDILGYSFENIEIQEYTKGDVNGDKTDDLVLLLLCLDGNAALEHVSVLFGDSQSLYVFGAMSELLGMAGWRFLSNLRVDSQVIQIDSSFNLKDEPRCCPTGKGKVYLQYVEKEGLIELN